MLQLSTAKEANKPLEKVSFKMGLWTTVYTEDNIPLSQFAVKLQDPVSKIPYETLGAFVKVDGLEVAKNYGDTMIELTTKTVNQRVPVVHANVWGFRGAALEKFQVACSKGEIDKAQLGNEEYLISLGCEALCVIPLGGSKDRGSQNRNRVSVSFISNNRLFWAPNPKENPTAAEEQNRAVNMFRRAIKDIFEGIDVTQFEKNGQLEGEASFEEIKEMHQHNKTLFEILKYLPEWRDPVQDGGAKSNTTVMSNTQKQMDELKSELEKQNA